MPTRGAAKARREAGRRTAEPVTRSGLSSRAHEGLHPRVAKHFDLFERGCYDGVLDSTVLAFIASSEDPVCTRAAEAKFRRWLDINRTWKQGRCVMWQAASRGLTAAIAAWHALGAGVEARDASGITALHIAVLRKHYDTVHALLRLGARPTSPTMRPVARPSFRSRRLRAPTSTMCCSTAWTRGRPRTRRTRLASMP